MEIKIPVYQPALNGNEKKYVNECLESTWISAKGKFIPLFEESFALFTGVKHAVAVCNGTAALHLAMLALGIGNGDEVLVPTLTYIAPVNAITYTGAVPVFVDSLPGTWQMDPSQLRKKITAKTRAVLAVHLYGHPCDMDALGEICRESGLFLIEDCAEAIGTKYKGKNAGTFGDIAVFSFFGNKTITTGEGGMVVTNNETLNDRATRFKGQGLAKNREYWHDIIGYNYRMNNIAAAIGLAQLEQVDYFLARKREIACRYREELADSAFVFHNETEDVTHSYWMCSILAADPEQRERLRAHLGNSGIETRPVFNPVHTMPMYSRKFQNYPVAEYLGWRGINLPSFPGLREEQVSFICKTIREFK